MAITVEVGHGVADAGDGCGRRVVGVRGKEVG